MLVGCYFFGSIPLAVTMSEVSPFVSGDGYPTALGVCTAQIDLLQQEEGSFKPGKSWSDIWWNVRWIASSVLFLFRKLIFTRYYISVFPNDCLERGGDSWPRVVVFLQISWVRRLMLARGAVLSISVSIFELSSPIDTSRSCICRYWRFTTAGIVLLFREPTEAYPV